QASSPTTTGVGAGFAIPGHLNNSPTDEKLTPNEKWLIVTKVMGKALSKKEANLLYAEKTRVILEKAVRGGINLAELLRGKDIAVVGPGAEELFVVVYLLQKYPDVNRVVVIDNSPWEVAGLQKELLRLPKSLRNKIEIRQADIANPDNVEEGRFALIYGSHVVVPNPIYDMGDLEIDSAWRVINKMLESNGVFIGFALATKEFDILFNVVVNEEENYVLVASKREAVSSPEGLLPVCVLSTNIRQTSSPIDLLLEKMKELYLKVRMTLFTWQSTQKN
ncbi:unnamed protein product, partial [marine sediment metagenome]